MRGPYTCVEDFLKEGDRGIEALNALIRLQRERIEELEEERGECVRQCPAPTIAQAAAMTHGEKLYIISEKQIDAALYMADKEDRKAGSTWAYRALEELGIERCKHENEDDGGCYDCHNRGWVK